MLNHVSIGVKDLAVSQRFYDAVLEPLGYKRVFESPEYVCYGTTYPEFCVVTATRPVAAAPRCGRPDPGTPGQGMRARKPRPAAQLSSVSLSLLRQ